ncbi:MAG: thioredoxin family protein [Candidatus Heimdallarchaeota archaeon]|nr:thioredoxin family protein [Candidatus Heimdallarchaeota archaeon]
MEIETNISRKKGKHILVFSDGCSDCLDHISNVEVGKCAGCKLEVFSIDEDSEQLKDKLHKYNIKSHPTTIIDEEIKVEGLPTFYWMCGDEFYSKLKIEYPLQLE